MLSVDQVNELLNILDTHNIMFVGRSLGPDYLNSDEKKKLSNAGIDLTKVYNPAKDTMLTSFYFGLISDAIGKKDATNVSFQQLKQSLIRGEYLPMTFKEKATLHSVKMQYLGDIKANQGKIFNDLNGIIREQDKKDRAAYENVIREEVLHGLKNKKTAGAIASALGHKTGDWSRNFGRITEFVSHQAFDEGRAALYERKHGEDALVYKQPYAGACKYCSKMYLTAGDGSEPKVFKLSVLRGNGTNIGKKAVNWLPVVGCTHPFCRCTLHYYDPDYIWDPETGGFTKPREKKLKVIRHKVNVQFNGQTFEV